MIIFEFLCKVDDDGKFKRPSINVQKHCVSHNNIWEANKAYKNAIRNGAKLPDLELNVNSLPDEISHIAGGYISRFRMTLG